MYFYCREELIERVLLSSMLNPGEQWQSFRHHGRTFTLEYRLRFRCDTNYYGPLCNKFCRARDDFFGHFNCDPSGIKVCKEGWTGAECRQAVCKQGCHMDHGSCDLPGECKCNYGWKGGLCDECETFPGCDHGTCTEPWKCVCDTNWGGLLCDKDLNYCGNHHPCKNMGTCTNTEPNEYLCVCKEGFRGRNCDIVEHACLSSPCENGGTCVEDPTGFSCACAQGWTGPSCASVVLQCDSNPCGRGATCQETPQGFQCLCPPFWTGRTCQLGLIRNLDHSVALLPPAQTVPTSVPMPVLCSEEIELTLPPSPVPSPAIKPAHGSKLDICNREREKLNRFHYAENQELEV
ncbi:protein jagged-2-like [Sinocyclocheilus rhinocerous]|uniref:protein jagged-2-like n=1 Tax=Sinocyclocheilus rhinocerous TaxID=307959 RepID=UPI0007B9F9DB|nr:PREDICTED: protein jagged-2-like [Sinocyclocheilus rhinocerous]